MRGPSMLRRFHLPILLALTVPEDMSSVNLSFATEVIVPRGVMITSPQSNMT